MRLIIATKNEGKLKEIKKILKGIRVPVISLSELQAKFRIKEDGDTFLENAIKKTKPVAEMYPEDIVAGEDSGLEVAYLDNKPGVYSKRYSGKNSSDLKNNRKILSRLAGVPYQKRRAAFCCTLVVFKGSRLLKKFEGRLRGVINQEIKGKNGFGYDPVVYLPDYKKTVAQLKLAVKNKISHRAQAFTKLKKWLMSMCFE